MSAAKFCELVESTLLDHLPRQHRRADSKLTASEKERLEKSFNTTWQLAQRLGDPKLATPTEDELRKLPLPELLRIKEVALFLYVNITEADRESIASSFSDATDAHESYDSTRIITGFQKITTIFNDRVYDERGGSYPIPDGAPLDIFSFFDQWQEDVEECVSAKT